MVPVWLKALLVPGSFGFLLLTLAAGVLLTFRRKDGGRAGKIWILCVFLFYWLLSTPLIAVRLVAALSPDVAIVTTAGDAPGASAIVVLGAGMQLHQSRGDAYSAPTREGSLRVIEAARLHRLLGGVPVIATGGNPHADYSEADLMAHQLEQLGVPADRIVREERSTNTRDHALFVPPLLRERGIERFILVTSQQHIARALAAFRAVGAHPLPSTPEIYARTGVFLEFYVPSGTGLDTSRALIYDLAARVYYKARGWT